MSDAIARDGLFRREAHEHMLRGEEGLRRLDVSPPWTWALTWLIALAMSTALVLSFVGSIEVNTRAVGIVRPTTGVSVMIASVAGTVAEVSAGVGSQLKAGESVLRIDVPQLESDLLQAERQVELLESEFREISARQDVLFEQQLARTQEHLNKLRKQIESERASVEIQRRKFAAIKSLEASAVISRFSVLDAQEAVSQAEVRLAGSEQALASARKELAALASQREAELWQRRQSLDGARANRDSAQMVHRQSAMTAPQAGTIEALLVKPGDDVRPGQVLAKLVPVDAPLHVISFLPEKDRAFVRVGDEVRLELDQLPYGEYGTLGARVIRIGDDLASAQEVEQALGDVRGLSAPTFPVTLEITEARAADAAGVRLRSGMLMQVRYTLRRQRPITIALDPVRKWLR